MMTFKRACLSFSLLLVSTIFYAQINLSIGKLGFSKGDYIDTDTVKSSSAWGLNATYEHFWVKHISASININTFSTVFMRYNPKIKNFSSVKDLFFNVETDAKYYPLRLDNSPYIGTGIGAHICDCYSFNKTDKIREATGGFDFHLKAGYQRIFNEKIVVHLGFVYSWIRPSKPTFLEKYMGLLQLGWVID